MPVSKRVTYTIWYFSWFSLVLPYKVLQQWNPSLDTAGVMRHFWNSYLPTRSTSRKYDTFRGKQAVLFLNLLWKGLTQEINGDGGSIWRVPHLPSYRCIVADWRTLWTDMLLSYVGHVSPRTYKGGGEGWWHPYSKVFLSIFLEDKTSAPDDFSSCLFIPRVHFETCSVMGSCYGYEIWCHK